MLGGFFDIYYLGFNIISVFSEDLGSYCFTGKCTENKYFLIPMDCNRLTTAPHACHLKA